MGDDAPFGPVFPNQANIVLTMVWPFKTFNNNFDIKSFSFLHYNIKLAPEIEKTLREEVERYLRQGCIDSKGQRLRWYPPAATLPYHKMIAKGLPSRLPRLPRHGQRQIFCSCDSAQSGFTEWRRLRYWRSILRPDHAQLQVRLALLCTSADFFDSVEASSARNKEFEFLPWRFLRFGTQGLGYPPFAFDAQRQQLCGLKVIYWRPKHPILWQQVR